MVVYKNVAYGYGAWLPGIFFSKIGVSYIVSGHNQEKVCLIIQQHGQNEEKQKSKQRA